MNSNKSSKSSSYSISSDQSYFDKNRHRPISEWLDVYKFFKCGVQGITGIFKSKQENYYYVFKVSKQIDYLVKHEYTAMKALNSLSYTKHFNKTFGILKCKVNMRNKKINIFDLSGCSIPIEVDVLIMRYIEDSFKFKHIIKDISMSDKYIYSIIKQTMLSIMMAQNSKKLTHYDLYYNNILLTPCDKNLVLFYILDDDTYYHVPTHGYRSNIIDFGFSYTNNMDGGYLWQDLGHTNHGFYSDRFNELADFKHLLVTLSDDISDRNSSVSNSNFTKIVKNVFKKFPVEWNTGWTKKYGISCTDEIVKNINNILYDDDVKIKTKLFTEYCDYSINLLKSLIVLPLKSKSIEFFDRSCYDFITEFNKIELNINSDFYSLYILQSMIDLSRGLRVDFYKDNEGRINAVQKFKNGIFEIINGIASFLTIFDTIDYNVLLNSLYRFSDAIEGCMYSNMKKQQYHYDSYKNLMPIQTSREIFDIVNINIGNNYHISSDTKIFAIDCRTKETKEFYFTNHELDIVDDNTNIENFIYNVYSTK